MILACRDKIKAVDAMQDIALQVYPSNVVFAKLDLASLKSVRQFVDNLEESKIDLIINNAGVFAAKGETENGFEKHFGINHLGHFLLTLLLLPKLRLSEHARVVNVASNSYACKKCALLYCTLNFTF